MKKITILLLCLSIATLMKAKDGLDSYRLTETQLTQPPHVEMKYHGFYAYIGYDFTMNLNKNHDEYKDEYMLHGITAVAGWQWRQASAVGIGFSYMHDMDGSFTQIPIFLEYRTHFLRSRWSPFTAIQMGYSIPFGSQNDGSAYTKIVDGGIVMGVQAGLRVAFSPRVGMSFFVGYQMMQERLVERGLDNEPVTRLPELYHNVKAGIGINF